MSQPLNVLSIEDSEDDVELIVRALRKGGYVPTSERVETAEAMRSALGHRAWDLVLSDHAMPHFTAPAALTLLQGSGNDIPFIVVSGVIGEEAAAALMRAGADDFISKNNLVRLVPSIERALRDADERHRRRQAEDAIHYQKTLLLCQNEATPDGILVIDADKVVSFNRRFQQMFSIPDDVMAYRSFQAIGSWMTDRVTAPDLWMARHAELAAMPDELGLDEIALKNGRTFERYSGPVKDEEGHIFGRVCQYHEITDRRRAEETLSRRHTIDRFFHFIDEPRPRRRDDRDVSAVSVRATRRDLHAADGHHPLDQRIRSFLILPGRPPASAGARRPARPGDFVRKITRPAGSSSDNGHPVVFDLDESLGTCSATTARGHGFRAGAIVTFQYKGEVVGEIELYSTRKELFSHETLDRLEIVADRLGTALGRARDQQQLRLQGAALASVGNAVFITDPNGAIEWVNESFTRLSGYRLDEAIGQTPRILKSGQQDNAFYVEVWSTILSGRLWRGELSERRKDGSVYLVNQTITPIRDPDGAIAHFVAIHEDITERKAAEARFEYVAEHDVLTGLANRTVFQRSLTEAMTRAKRNGTMLGVMFLDLDRFKIINDSLGHISGDQLLKAIASRLRAAVRSTDVVARLGGDEFAIIQTDLVQNSGSVTLARKLLELIAEPIMLDSQEVGTSASLGITIYPNDESEPEQLLKNADLAMYRAKSEGRNRYRFFSPQMNEDVQARHALENDIRQALEHHEFSLQYQPEINQGTRRIIGVEALLRWQRDGRGLVSPSEFIAVAEDCGLIIPLSQWVLDEACTQNRAWQDAGFAPIVVSINISPIQFRRDDIVATVRQRSGAGRTRWQVARARDHGRNAHE